MVRDADPVAGAEPSVIDGLPIASPDVGMEKMRVGVYEGAQLDASSSRRSMKAALAAASMRWMMSS